MLVAYLTWRANSKKVLDESIKFMNTRIITQGFLIGVILGGVLIGTIPIHRKHGDCGAVVIKPKSAFDEIAGQKK